MKEVLLRNYSEKDEESLEILCVKYEGRSAELEQYLEKHFKDIPTKLEVKQTNARAVLEAELKSLQDAGIEEVATLAIEDCPGCRMPQMTFDTTVEMYHCKECNKEFCRVCWQPCLAPDLCQKCLKEEFEIINLLPKREFEEDDPMADEFRKAEAQFLRMQAKGRHTNMEIQSIDIVRNRRLQQKFEAKKAQLAAKEGSDVKSLLLFHGTPQQNVPSILRDNFDLSKVVNGRAHGNGVYFSEQPEVSLSYSMTPANRPYPPGHVSFWPFSQSGLLGITFPGITFQQVQSAPQPTNPFSQVSIWPASSTSQQVQIAPQPTNPFTQVSIWPASSTSQQVQSVPQPTNQGGKKRKRELDENKNEEAATSLILCQVLMGSNIKEVKHAGASACWAIVVPDVDQILPRFVLHLKKAGN